MTRPPSPWRAAHARGPSPATCTLAALSLVGLGLLAPGCLSTGAVTCGEDGFCPPGTTCTPDQDPPVCVPARGCGNGDIDPNTEEVCDDGNVRSGDGCSANCQSDEECGNGIRDVDLDEPEECDDGEETSRCNDDCTRAECGDGLVNRAADEVCDDGNTDNGDGCDDACKSEECGNGRVEEAFGEQCDDGNSENNDGCSANCQNELCGNGNLDPGERCDEAAGSEAIDNFNDDCIVLSATECFEAECGDGFVWDEGDGDEECDDEGESADCDANCTLAACGDATRNRTAGEVCDDGGETEFCDDDCTTPRCGDSNTNEAAGEQCDTGGESATCNANCTLPACGDQIVNEAAGEQCDTGSASSFCNSSCQLSACGDGETDTSAGEQCDAAGMSAACDANCTTALCGDGTINSLFVVDLLGPGDTLTGEQCDPGLGTTGNPQRANQDAPTCDRDCSFARCGDGYENNAAGEECDDQYVASGPKPPTDGCNTDCTEAACGDGKLNSAFIVDLFATAATLTGKDCDPGTGTSDNDRRAQADGPSCDADCSAVRCGDGRLNAAAGEHCDGTFVQPGEVPVNTGSCDSDCTFASCGDGRVNNQFVIRYLFNDTTTALGEACDPATGTNPSDMQRALSNTPDCDLDCSIQRCGDGYVNTAAGETCDSTAYQPGVIPPATATCDSDCTAPACGDGVVNPAAGEGCDDAGNSEDCDADCTDADCGDGYVNPAAGEDCDDQDGDNNDGCRNDCTVVCGDGNLWTSGPAAEECDDGNTTNGDGCDSNCNTEGP